MHKGTRSEVADAKNPTSTESMFWRVGTISEHAEELRADKYCPRGLEGREHQAYFVPG